MPRERAILRGFFDFKMAKRYKKVASVIRQILMAFWEFCCSFLSWWTVERTALLVATLSAAIALWGLYQNGRIARAATRPMMMVEYMRPTAENPHLKLKISNKGKSVARNVRFTFEPKLPKPDLNKLQKEYEFRGRYAPIELVQALFEDTKFDTWPPGFESEYLFWIKPPQLDLLSNNTESVEGIPARQTVKIVFEDDFKKRFSEVIVLDIRSVAGTTFIRSGEYPNG